MPEPTISISDAAAELDITPKATRARLYRRMDDLPAGHAIKRPGGWLLTAEAVALLNEDLRSKITPRPAPPVHSPTAGTSLSTADLELGFVRGELADTRAALYATETASLRSENARLRSKVE